MADALTDRQQDVFDTLVEYITDHGIAPTVRELGDELGGIANKAVVAHLDALERKGWIGKHPGVSRGIYIRLGNTCPCCGQAIKGGK